MQKAAISVLGNDRPGIVAAVSRILFENACNVEDVSQTALQGEFAAIFIVFPTRDWRIEELRRALETGLAPMGLRVLVKIMEAAPEQPAAVPSEPFVVTTTGPDRLGLVAGITDVMARFQVNIANLKAAFRGGDDPLANTMIYEVEVPLGIDQPAFRKALADRARDLGLDLSLQHRDIFEAIHRM